jgi:hypothetical protein
LHSGHTDLLRISKPISTAIFLRHRKIIWAIPLAHIRKRCHFNRYFPVETQFLIGTTNSQDASAQSHVGSAIPFVRKLTIMKTAKQRIPVQDITVPPTADRQRLILKTREIRLLLQMVRNTPAENQRLRRQCALQRQCLGSAIAAARRFSRRVARAPIELQQDIRQIQDSPFYDELGAISALTPKFKNVEADYKRQLKLEF